MPDDRSDDTRENDASPSPDRTTASDAARAGVSGVRSSVAAAGLRGGVTLTVRVEPEQHHSETMTLDESDLSLHHSRDDSPERGDPGTVDIAGAISDDDDDAYVILGEYARGGMGAIMQTIDRDLRREVAMKVMLSDDASEGTKRRFIREGRVTAALEHPNIVPVHDMGRDEAGRVWFIMKLVRGRSLKDVIALLSDGDARALRRYTMTWICTTFNRICDGMSFAHSRGVVHRDLKPENIMVGDHGEVLVMDWGLAKPKGTRAVKEPSEPEDETDRDLAETAELLKSAGATASVSTEGDLVGTPAYMSPEQAEGRVGDIDERSDIYALGAILYELLTLRRPVEGETIYEILFNISEGTIPEPDEIAPEREIPKALSAVAMKGLSLDPEDRYASAEEMRGEVERYIEGLSVGAAEESFFHAIGRIVMRNKIVCALGALCMILLGSAAWWSNARNVALLEKTREALANLDTASSEQSDAREKRADTESDFAPKLFERAREAVAAGDAEQALEDLATTLEYDPEMPEAWLWSTLLRAKRHEYGEARRCFAVYLALEDSDRYTKLFDIHLGKMEREPNRDSAARVREYLRGYGVAYDHELLHEGDAE